MSDFNNHDTVVPSVEKDNVTPNNAQLENAKNAIVNNASAAASAVANHPITQNIANHPITQNIANGPVAANIKDQSAKTQGEFSALAASRTTPATPAATGQNLTHYHSFFFNLLSWKNPRASGIAYLAVVSFIFAARYLNIIRYGFKLTYMVLGVTVLAEVAGKMLFSTGFASQVRPRKYYVVPKQTLEGLTGDFHELVNFFVIETQRIVFAENVPVSTAAFVSALLSYFLIKFVPFWGLSLIATSVLFLGPLIYKTNQELIDHHLNNASHVINQQTGQMKTLASQHASHATEATKSFVGDYSAKAQEMIGNARGRSTSPTAVKKESVPTTSAYKADDFPAAPKQDISSTPALKQDFPVAPTQDFTAPPVGAQVNSLRTEEPLI